MKTRKLGRTGIEISTMGIGGMSFSNFYGPTDEAESFAILDAAMAAGVNHLDTSNIYGMGRSETVIGAYLAARGAEARDFFSIATKASITKHPDTGARFYDNSAEHLNSELDKSLVKMGVEQIDLFYVHRREAARPIEEVTETLAAMVQAGKIRSFGFSEIAPTSLRRAAAVHPVAAVQSEYSLSTRSPEMGLVQACGEIGTSLVAFSPVGRSLLTDHPLSAAQVKDLPFLAGNERFQEPNFSANIARTDRFRALAAEMGVSAAGLAIAWLISRGEQVIPIPGTRSAVHFAELVQGIDFDLGADDLARIDAVLPIGWAHGDRYNVDQWDGPEKYC
ncbi:MAG: aldo/keto reductase [Rhodobacterales bacterium]|nr:aldo/keto reductase [Rhodobacterales bacterium]